jgi:hypothetical protein
MFISGVAQASNLFSLSLLLVQVKIFRVQAWMPGDVIQALTAIMPLYQADDSIDPYTLLRVPEQFIIFFSSITTEDGQMWCPVATPYISNSVYR